MAIWRIMRKVSSPGGTMSGFYLCNNWGQSGLKMLLRLWQANRTVYYRKDQHGQDPLEVQSNASGESAGKGLTRHFRTLIGGTLRPRTPARLLGPPRFPSRLYLSEGSGSTSTTRNYTSVSPSQRGGVVPALFQVIGQNGGTNFPGS